MRSGWDDKARSLGGRPSAGRRPAEGQQKPRCAADLSARAAGERGPLQLGVLGATQRWLGEARTPGRALTLITRPFWT